MPEYETTVVVAAPPEVVWAVTSDIERWPEWSPTMDSVTRLDSGRLRAGSTARIKQPRLTEGVWEVDEAKPSGSFVWHTGSGGYQVQAVHRWKAVDGGTEVRLIARVTGILAPVIWALTGRTIRRYLDEEAAGLKIECEKPR